jgi:hypothetical protein
MPAAGRIASSPFGPSLSKPHLAQAPDREGKPFDKLRASGVDESSPSHLASREKRLL